MADYEIMIVLNALEGEDPVDCAEALLTAFEDACPDIPATAAANTEARTFDVMVTATAPSADKAFERVKDPVIRALAASTLEPREITAIDVRVAALDVVYA